MSHRSASQLEYGKGIQCVVVVVVIIDGELLVLVQNLVVVNRELIATVRGLGNVLREGVGASRAWEILQHTLCDWIKTRCRYFVVGENSTVRRSSNGSRTSLHRDCVSATGPILQNRSHRVVRKGPAEWGRCSRRGKISRLVRARGDGHLL